MAAAELRGLENRREAIAQKYMTGELPKQPVPINEMPKLREGQPVCVKWNGAWIRVHKAGREVNIMAGCGRMDCMTCGERIARRCQHEARAGYAYNHGDAETDLLTLTYPARQETDWVGTVAVAWETADQLIARAAKNKMRCRRPQELDDDINWDKQPKTVSLQVANKNWNRYERVLWIFSLSEGQLSKWDTGNWNRLMEAWQKWQGAPLTFYWTREMTRQGMLHRHAAYKVPPGFRPRGFTEHRWLQETWAWITGFTPKAGLPTHDVQVQWYGGKFGKAKTNNYTIGYIMKYLGKDWTLFRQRRQLDGIWNLQPDAVKDRKMRRRDKSNDWGDAIVGDWGKFHTETGEVIDHHSRRRAYARSRYWLKQIEKLAVCPRSWTDVTAKTTANQVARHMERWYDREKFKTYDQAMRAGYQADFNGTNLDDHKTFWKIGVQTADGKFTPQKLI